MYWRATAAGWGNEENDGSIMQSILASLSNHAIPAPGLCLTMDTLKSLQK
jgi:hypothetical protein